MKFIHLSDLHIGKRVFEFSMIEDQKYILKKIISIIDEENPDGIIIAGDVYDKPVPSAEAVQVFDEFLVGLSHRKIPVFIISGNHDSPERLSFAARILGEQGIHLAGGYDGDIHPVELEDESGKLNVWLLPFIKPANVRGFFEDADIEINTYTQAVRAVISRMDIDINERNLLVAHQFVTGALRCESEEISVGGLDNVEADVFDDFDYVALGHIHTPQKVGRETVRYCGTPLKYSFSEARGQKSVTIVNLAAKGQVGLCTVPLIPERDMREIRGSYEEITLKKNYEATNTLDYVHITLTDEEDIPDAIGKLRVIYPNLMRLDYDNKRTRSGFEISDSGDMERKSPMELFGELYEAQNNQPMSSEQQEFVAELIEKIWEDEE